MTEISLKDYINEASTFLRIHPGETVYCQYLGYKVVPNRFDPEAKSVQYILVVNGIEKTFESRSINLAEQFSEIPEGSWVKITRTGEGSKTKYKVEAVSSPDEEITDDDLNEIDKRVTKPAGSPDPKKETQA